MKLEYTCNYLHPEKGDEADLGVDLPYGGEKIVLQPGQSIVFDTGVAFKFPLFSRVRRLFTRLLLGSEITGIGALVWPRGRHEHAVLSGVVDPGYRGTIKVRLNNPTDEPIEIEGKVAQMVLVPSIKVDLENVHVLDKDTKRGDKGGINESIKNVIREYVRY